MPSAASPTLAISSWSVHRAMGILYPNAPGNDVAGKAEEKWGLGTVSLMDLPRAIRNAGFDRLHLCHFHLASRDRSYLAEVRAAIVDAGVTLETVLIDDGDLSDPATRRRDIDWIARWVDAAGELGAKKARVIAGKQKPTTAALDLSVDGLRALARRGRAAGVRVITENWFDLLAGPREVDYVLDRLDGEVGLLADFGNWKGPRKYADLAAIFGRAEDCHAKCYFERVGEMDADDYGRCLEAAYASGYDGPYTVIYEGPDADEWEAVAMERDYVLDFFERKTASPPLRRAS
jgi:sugar phosphate isomerase/epimerase